MKNWYWYGQIPYFDKFGFTEIEENMNFHGPFKTLTKAKEDALDYYNFVAKHAGIAICDIESQSKVFAKDMPDNGLRDNVRRS